MEGADGIKTGFTRAAGRILVSSAVRDGRRIVIVTIDDGNDWADHQALYADAFERYSIQTIVRKGDVLGAVQIFGGETDRVPLIAGEDFSYALTVDEEVTLVLPSPGFVYAPVARGQNAGSAHLYLDDALKLGEK